MKPRKEQNRAAQSEGKQSKRGRSEYVRQENKFSVTRLEKNETKKDLGKRTQTPLSLRPST